jgi:hypothetical protein
MDLLDRLEFQKGEQLKKFNWELVEFPTLKSYSF